MLSYLFYYNGFTLNSKLKTETQKREIEKKLEQVDQLAGLLDDFLRIPGVGWRIGLESLIGIIPYAGDVAGGLLSLVVLLRAFQFRLPKIVMVRMIANTILDFTVGAIPIIGDLFDFAFKANRRNARMLRQYASDPTKSTLGHWLFLIGLVAGFVLFMLSFVVALFWLLSYLLSLLF